MPIVDDQLLPLSADLDVQRQITTFPAAAASTLPQKNRSESLHDDTNGPSLFLPGPLINLAPPVITVRLQRWLIYFPLRQSRLDIGK